MPSSELTRSLNMVFKVYKKYKVELLIEYQYFILNFYRSFMYSPKPKALAKGAITIQ